jgi:hypothetical protein
MNYEDGTVIKILTGIHRDKKATRVTIHSPIYQNKKMQAWCVDDYGLIPDSCLSNFEVIDEPQKPNVIKDHEDRIRALEESIKALTNTTHALSMKGMKY